jgi:hypothetical protein
MKPVAKAASPAAIAVLRQATKLWPKRKKSSDGLLPSAAHLKQNPNSDHNTGLAADLTHDPKNGVDCKKLFEQLKKDKRVKYLIFNKKIWIRGRGEKAYTGSNPHRTHLHISIRDGYGTDVSPWFKPVAPVKVAPVEKKPVKKAAPKKAETKSKYGKSIIGSLLSKKSKPVCTCKTCPVHKKGK